MSIAKTCRVMSESTRIDAHEWIRRLELAPHPEGGYFRETYRSPLRVRTEAGPDRERAASTAIYFLLAEGDFSALHRIASDEVWHFYAGCSLLVSAIMPDGALRTWRLGTNVAAGDLPQCVVPAGAWFGAELAGDRASARCSSSYPCRASAGCSSSYPVEVTDSAGDRSYALVGCTVAPGFEFADFELGDRNDLTASYPQHSSLIARLTHAQNKSD